jgi:hypothetical protein
VLLNVMGIYGLLQGLRYKTALDLGKRLDNQRYAEDETITLKIPMTIPYQLNSKTEYQRVDGEIEHNGEFFRLVKQKLENDTLYMICIKDRASTRINKVLSDYVETFTDKPIQSSSNGKFFNGFIKDYLPSSIAITSVSSGWNFCVVRATIEEFFSSRSIAVINPPPQG